MPRVVDQGRFDALGGGDCHDAGDDASAHAGEHVTERREGACFGVCEGVIDRVVGEEADTVFGDGADD